MRALNEEKKLTGIILRVRLFKGETTPYPSSFKAETKLGKLISSQGLGAGILSDAHFRCG